MLSRHAGVLRRWPNVLLRSQAATAEHASLPQPGLRAMATAAPAKPPSSNDPFANGTNAYYVEEMYRLWRQDPKSVHVSWNVYFTGMDKKGLSSPQAFQPPPSVVPMPAGGAPSLHSAGGGELDDHLKVRETIKRPTSIFGFIGIRATTGDRDCGPWWTLCEIEQVISKWPDSRLYTSFIIFPRLLVNLAVLIWETRIQNTNQ